MTPFQLCSRALVKIGANPISSFSQGTAESDIAAHLYDTTRDSILSLHPWSFATGQIRLVQLLAAPVADFAHAYQLPGDFLRVLSLGDINLNAGSGARYRIHQQRIHTDLDGAMLTYIFRPDESGFPAFFDGALIARLAGEMCLPITESSSRTKNMMEIAEIELRRAKVIDSQQQTPKSFTDFTLIKARA